MKSTFIKYVILFSLSLIGLDSYAQKIRTIAGNGVFATSANAGDGGSARSASFGYPMGIAGDTSGNLFISDSHWNVIRKISPNGVISTYAGVGFPGYDSTGIAATAVRIQSPALMVCDVSGNLYFADNGNRIVRKIDTNGIITTIAGTRNPFNIYCCDNGPATSADIGAGSVCFDNAGNMYISDYNSRVRKVNTAGIITTLAGDGSLSNGGDGGLATAAQIDAPGGVAADALGNIFITERGAGANVGINVIRKVNAAGIISRFAGLAVGFGLSGNGGPATNAKISSPNGIKVDDAGNIYFADQGNNQIRKIDAVTNIITSIAGSVGGFGGDGGSPTVAKFSAPSDLYFGKHGKIYISDKGSSNNNTFGHRIREIFYVDTFHISANPGTVLCGTALASFTAHISEAYYFFNYQWQHNGAVVGTNSPNYAPTVLHNNDIITCSLIDTANGGMVLAISDTIHMTIQPPILPVVTATSSGDTICAGNPVTLTATAVNGGTSPRFYWYLFGVLLDSGSVFTYIPAPGDIVTCVLVSSDACALPNTVNTVHPLSVTPSYHPIITVSTVPGTTITHWGEVISMYSTVTYGGFTPTFQWYKNNVTIPGATSSSYAASIDFPDTFYCVMNSSASCVVPPLDTSNYIYISTGTLGVGGINDGANRIGLYPNPNKGSFTIKGMVKNLPDGVMNIEVKTLLGQTVFSSTVNCQNGRIDKPIKLSDDIPEGMYFLTTTNDSGTNAIPFMIRK